MMHAPDAPLLPLRRPNSTQRRWSHLPRRDSFLAAFLVKISDVLVNGIFTLNVLSATYFLSWGKPDPKDVMSLCIVSSIGWKAFVFGLPFALYPFTLWINGVARSAEVDLRGLSTVSIWVFLEIIWCVLLSALLTHCASEASYIHVIIVAACLIVILVIMWGFTFNHPACFRWCCCDCCCSWWCCCCLPPGIAAAEASDQARVAEELARQVARAQAAFAAHLRLQEEAATAKRRQLEAENAHKNATNYAETSRQLAEEAVTAFHAAKGELLAKAKAKEDSSRVKLEKESLATDARASATNADAAQLEAANAAAAAAETEFQEATQVDSAAAVDICASYRKVVDTFSTNKFAEHDLLVAGKKLEDTKQESDAATVAATMVSQKESEVRTAARATYQQLEAVRAVALV